MDDAQFEQMMGLIAREFAKVHDRLDVLTDRVDVLTHRVDVLTERVDVLTERVDILTGRVDNLTGRQDAVESALATLRSEMRERFDSVNDRFTTIDMRFTTIDMRLARLEDGWSSVVAEIRKLSVQMDAVQTSLVHLNGRVDTLADDMRQRFRVVTEQLVDVERRLAA